MLASAKFEIPGFRHMTSKCVHRSIKHIDLVSRSRAASVDQLYVSLSSGTASFTDIRKSV